MVEIKFMIQGQLSTTRFMKLNYQYPAVQRSWAAARKL